jgi:hypothetical protein
MPDTPPFVLAELAVVFAAKTFDPTFLTPEFLVARSIVPKDWELSPSRILSPQISWVEYKCGVKITCEPEKLSFTQA